MHPSIISALLCIPESEAWDGPWSLSPNNTTYLWCAHVRASGVDGRNRRNYSDIPYGLHVLPYGKKLKGQVNLLVYCVGVDSEGPAQHVLEIKFYDNAFLY